MPSLVAVEGPPGPDFAAQIRRIWDAGDAVFPIDHRLPPPARRRLLETINPRRPVEAGDALVLATSGTTGESKGVVLTHAAVEASANATSRRLGVDPARDTWICCLPVAHAGGMGVVTRALLTGTRLVVLPTFDKDAVERHEGSLISLVPTALQRVDPTRFKTIVLGGDRPPPVVPPNAVVTYGLTETGGGCVYDGVALDGVDVRVRDGEIHIRGALNARAYRHADHDEPIGEWLPTGDGGDCGDDKLVVDGRLADVIVTGGEKVWPAVVEEALAALPEVREVAIVGRPDPEWGQRVVAIVVAAPGTTPSLKELAARVRTLLPPWAAPKELELVTELPRTSLGKVRRGAASPRR